MARTTVKRALSETAAMLKTCFQGMVGSIKGLGERPARPKILKFGKANFALIPCQPMNDDPKAESMTLRQMGDPPYGE